MNLALWKPLISFIILTMKIIYYGSLLYGGGIEIEIDAYYEIRFELQMYFDYFHL